MSLKIVCHPTAGREEEDTTLDLTYTVGCAPLVGSQMTTVAGVEAGGILKGVSSGLLRGWSVVQGLFRARAAGGG